MHGLRQSIDELLIPVPSDRNRCESAVCGHDAVELAVSALLKEILSVRGLRYDQLRDVAEGIPGLLGTCKFLVSPLFENDNCSLIKLSEQDGFRLRGHDL